MLYIDVVCINYDGNAFDAAVMAVMAALRNSQSACLTLEDRLSAKGSRRLTCL